MINNFDPLNRRRPLTRSREHKMFFGVCGGIADYMGWDPTVVRLVTLLLMFPLHVLNVLVYFILAILLPKAPPMFYMAPDQPPNQPHPYD